MQIHKFIIDGTDLRGYVWSRDEGYNIAPVGKPTPTRYFFDLEIVCEEWQITTEQFTKSYQRYLKNKEKRR